MSNLHFDQPKRKKSFSGKGKGFYVALAVCLVAVGAAAWTTWNSVSNLTQKEPDPTPSNQIVVGVSSDGKGVSSQTVSQPGTSSSAPTASSKPSVSSKPPVASQKPTSSAVASSEPVKDVVVTPTTFLMPSGGKVLKEFSNEQSLYSMTFGDWRIHEGIDIAMNQGSTVQAIGDGKVTDVYEDDMYGTVAVIAHEAGLEARYCGLAKNTTVKKGEAVKGGQVIGSVGEIPCEVVDESHLHFEIRKDGVCVDPLAAMGKKGTTASSQ